MLFSKPISRSAIRKQIPDAGSMCKEPNDCQTPSYPVSPGHIEAPQHHVVVRNLSINEIDVTYLHAVGYLVLLVTQALDPTDHF